MRPLGTLMLVLFLVGCAVPREPASGGFTASLRVRIVRVDADHDVAGVIRPQMKRERTTDPFEEWGSVTN